MAMRNFKGCTGKCAEWVYFTQDFVHQYKEEAQKSLLVKEELLLLRIQDMAVTIVANMDIHFLRVVERLEPQWGIGGVIFVFLVLYQSVLKVINTHSTIRKTFKKNLII